MSFAMRIAVEPTPLPAACTRMVSPGSSLALSNSMCCTVPKVTEAQAACGQETPSGTGTRRCAGRFTTSAASPSTRSEEHTSELQSLMRISYAVFCLKKKKTTQHKEDQSYHILTQRLHYN